jgi:hypothetical protein
VTADGRVRGPVALLLGSARSADAAFDGVLPDVPRIALHSTKRGSVVLRAVEGGSFPGAFRIYTASSLQLFVQVCML